MLFVGDDWSEAHHDVFLMDETGARLASRRFREGIEGVRRFHDLVAEWVSDPKEVVVGIETDRGLWVDALVAAGYQVFAVNPRSVSRYRDRHSVSGAKSDSGDAKLLADLVRTDRHNHRPVAGDSPRVEAVKVLARTHQNLVWERRRHANRLRSALREYYPAALATFKDLTSGDCLAVLAKAPTPTEAAGLTKPQIRAVLKRAGRQRSLDSRTVEIQTGLRTSQLQAPGAVEAGFGATTRALVAVIAEINTQISRLETELENSFSQHPDAGIYLSQPGLGVILGARVLGEFGDDPDRYTDLKARRNYAGTSPVTISSGQHRAVVARWVRNDRLYDAVIRWAFSSLTTSPGCRYYYDQRRSRGDSHYRALRNLGNRLVGILDGCLKHQTPYDENTAWGHHQPAQVATAA